MATHPLLFRVRGELRAFRHVEGAVPRIVTLNPGDTLILVPETRLAGLVDVYSTEGVRYTTFYNDLIEKADLVEEKLS